MKRIVSLVVFLLCALMMSAQIAKPKPLIDIQQLMSHSEFNRAGLQKLSPEELQALNDWLVGYSLRLVSPSDSLKSGDAIESRIAGDFEGWSGETIFKLDNGQIWQQSSYAYTYHYAYRPEVTIYKTTGGYKMKVEDVSDTIYVKRLK